MIELKNVERSYDTRPTETCVLAASDLLSRKTKLLQKIRYATTNQAGE
jgi:hypothetical protein